MSQPHPRIGVAAVVSNANGQILVGKRMGSHGSGTWQLPGGHLEYQEEVLVCAERETLEETALRVKAHGIMAVTNDIFENEGKHYITLFVHCEMLDPKQQPQVMEPHKCESWLWRTWGDLKAMNDAAVLGDAGDQLFLPIINLLKQTSDPGRLVPRGILGTA
ncbi:Nudix hydrolase 1 [Escovopsis weberi]|uniref:Nudix hydrolase 1 n=1 Tax=Escovopsis weberi TaxID=150374 RepID=A0A0M9VW43_ESCWE|nr:Nudix hydrolase 1 [Escovopsis weberi]